MQKVRKCIIPAAGFWTRFLPATKAQPKEMLPIVDKPVIQYVIEELVEAWIEDIIIVTGYHKRSIEDHFDEPSGELAKILLDWGVKKAKMLDALKKISNLANFTFVRQKWPYWNGTPLLNVQHLIANEPFIYALADDFIVASPSRFRQMISAYEKYGVMNLSCLRVHNDDDYNRYGFVGGTEIEPWIVDMNVVIEKPGKENAPGNLAAVCGGLFTPEIFPYLERAKKEMREWDELYYNNALKLMLADGKKLMWVEIKNGKYYDTGNKLEYMKTVVEFALKHEEIGSDFDGWLRDFMQNR